jgi:hypothetical protein
MKHNTNILILYCMSQNVWIQYFRNKKVKDRLNYQLKVLRHKIGEVFST